MAYPYGGQRPDPLPSIHLVRNAWEGGRSVVAATLDVAVNWLRNATRYAINAFQAHPITGGVLVVGVIGGAFIVAPQASWALLKQAAGYLARNAGRVIAATVLAEVCPDCWVYA